MAHKEHGVIFVELKSTIGRLSEFQEKWIDTLKKAGATVYVWRPLDINEARIVLQGGTK